MRTEISTLIVKKIILNTEDATVFVNCRPNEMKLLTRLIGSHQMLTAILNPFDRSLEAQCSKKHKYIFGIEFPTNAESTANMRFKKVQPRRAPTQHLGKSVTILMRHLRGTM